MEGRPTPGVKKLHQRLMRESASLAAMRSGVRSPWIPPDMLDDAASVGLFFVKGMICTIFRTNVAVFQVILPVLYEKSLLLRYLLKSFFWNLKEL